jgi:hypothetical protein
MDAAVGRVAVLVHLQVGRQPAQQTTRALQRAGQIRTDVGVVPGLGRRVEHVVEADDLHHVDGADPEDLRQLDRGLRIDVRTLLVDDVERGEKRPAPDGVLLDLGVDPLSSRA